MILCYIINVRFLSLTVQLLPLHSYKVVLLRLNIITGCALFCFLFFLLVYNFESQQRFAFCPFKVHSPHYRKRVYIKKKKRKLSTFFY